MNTYSVVDSLETNDTLGCICEAFGFLQCEIVVETDLPIVSCLISLLSISEVTVLPVLPLYQNCVYIFQVLGDLDLYEWEGNSTDLESSIRKETLTELVEVFSFILCGANEAEKQ